MAELFYNRINNVIITTKKKIFFYLFLFIVVDNVSLFGQSTDSLVPVEVFHTDGSLASKGFMRNNKPDGYWITYYPNGVKKSEGNRLNHLLDGIWTFYDSTGSVSTVIEYSMGFKNGKLVNFENGIVKDSSIYSNDTLMGFKYIFANNRVERIIPYRKGVEHGDGFEFDESGRIITVMKYSDGALVRQLKINRRNAEGKLNGIYMDFYENYALKIEGFYSNGLKNGLFKYYSLNGDLIRSELWKDDVLVIDTSGAKVNFKRYYHPNSLIVSREGLFLLDTIPVGRHNFFDNNGTYFQSIIYNTNGIRVFEGTFTLENERTGFWVEYYDNGNIRSKGEYKNGMKTGKWEYFYYNGQLEQTGSYINDVPHGLWTTFCDNGNIIKKGSYLNGREDGEFVEYTCMGELLKKISFDEGLKSGDYELHINNFIEKGQYIDDLKVGKWQTFYNDDKIREVLYFENDLENGKFTKYYFNGNVMIQGQFVNGKREGLWNFFDQNGIKYLTIEYKNGEEIKYNGKRIYIK